MNFLHERITALLLGLLSLMVSAAQFVDAVSLVVGSLTFGRVVHLNTTGWLMHNSAFKFALGVLLVERHLGHKKKR